jgi:hypothetical protein
MENNGQKEVSEIGSQEAEVGNPLGHHVEVEFQGLPVHKGISGLLYVS